MQLENLLQQPEARRDETWERDFLREVISTKVQLDDEQASEGPDGWPYLKARTSAEAKEPFKEVAHWLATRGIGLALNTHKMVPDYIFTYGMIWNFLETGEFRTAPAEAKAGEVNIGADEKMIVGEPAPSYLPKYVRNILREFLKAQGFANVRIAAMTSGDFKHVDLIFEIESFGGLPENQHRVLAEAISWFLPLHYSLVFASSKNIRGFVDL